MNQPDLQNVFREGAWRHFTIHAEQRLKMFQFYITISTALLAGGVLLLRTGENAIALVLLGFLASFFSFVFWKLEIRTRTLVKNAEDAIKHLDGSHEFADVDGQPNPLKLFTRDDFQTQRSNWYCALWHFSYHKCFSMVFVVIAILGALGIIYGVTEVLGTDSNLEPPTAGGD